jgi:hypothetical protein
MYFTTTRAAPGAGRRHLRRRDHRRGARPDRSSTRSRATSTGQARRAGRARRRRERIPYVSVAATVNMAGGQPISMANLRAVRALLRAGASVILDATRAIENAWFIKQREPGYATARIAEILLEICSLHRRLHHERQERPPGQHRRLPRAQRWTLAEEARNLVVLYEGLHTYGGLAGRDMEAMAIGIARRLDDHHIRARIGQVEYVGERLARGGRAHRAPHRRPRGVPRRAGLPAAHPAGPVPRAGARRRAVPRLGHARDGARHRLRRPRQGDGRAQPPEARARAAHLPASRVHAGPLRRHRGVGDRRV